MRRLGRYALLNRFASGEHSEIYFARVEERIPHGEIAVHELCALKMVRGDVASDMDYARLLLTEGAAAVRFRHPVSVPVHEVERVGADLFVTSDYVLGQTLASFLQRMATLGTTIPTELILFIGAEVASALSKALERPWSSTTPGMILHGGLSPRSILLTYDGQVRLLGLGSGRARISLPPPKARLHYVAPEVLEQKTVDRRTDLFSLGAILFDALTGRRLFRRSTDLETRLAILEEPPPPLRPSMTGVDEELSTLLEQMVTRASERRPSGPDAVEASLRRRAPDSESAARRLASMLDLTFREDRDAQRRVLDAAVKKLPGTQTRVRVEAPRAPSGRREPPRTTGEEVTEDGNLDQLLPDLLGGQIPVLAELSADGTPIPLVRRSSKPGPREPSGTGIEPTLELARPELPLWTPASPIEVGSTSVGKNWPEPEASRDSMGPTEDLRAPPEAGPPFALVAEDIGGSLEDALSISGEVPLISPASDASGPGVMRYRRGQLVAVSETSSVYSATDAILGRKVALKTSEVGDESGARVERAQRIRMLRREARLGAGVIHPRLPVVLDAGRDGEIFYIVYPFVEGVTVDRFVLERGPIPEPLAEVLLKDLASALAALHRAGIIHGDVGPSNVMIEPEGRARLVDFSAAISALEEAPPELISRARALIPELTAGARYDARAEQFQLGILALSMLSAKPIEAALAASEEILARVGGRLKAVVLRLLDRDPGRRFADVAEVEAALGGPAPLRAPSLPARAARPVAEGLLDLESLLSRIAALAPVDTDRDAPGPLCRGIARRLELGAAVESDAVLLASTRRFLQRVDLPTPEAERQGLLSPEMSARLLRMDQRLVEGRGPDAAISAVEIALVVDQYLNAIQPGEDGRRVSPRRAIMALRERVGEGRFSAPVVEALIDHLRDVISALEVPPRKLRPRVLLAGVSERSAIGALLTEQGFEVEVGADVDDAMARLGKAGFIGVIADRSIPRPSGRTLLERLREDARLSALPIVVLGGGAEDTAEAQGPPREEAEILLPRAAPPEQIYRVFLQKAAPKAEQRS
ncbi:MAG: protein kinase [Myxococcota bacterium]